MRVRMGTRERYPRPIIVEHSTKPRYFDVHVGRLIDRYTVKTEVYVDDKGALEFVDWIAESEMTKEERDEVIDTIHALITAEGV